MTIDKIGKINNIYKANNKNNVNKADNINKTDSINISQEAHKKAEIEKYLKIVKNSPDIRSDKVEAAKKNLDEYFSDEKKLDTIIDNISQKIADKITT